MIISHKYKYIFLKTNKTAGTSIEIALSKYCGSSDIITPISPVDEILRKKLGGLGPQNYKSQTQGTDFYNHISAYEIKKLIGEDIWAEYYKFCFERNPWDRIISLYYWIYRNEPRPTLFAFLNSELPLRLHERGYNIYTIDDKVVVDRIFRYESINEELKTLSETIGFSGEILLPNAKAGHRKDKRHYKDVIDEASKEKIAEILGKEIKLLGYEF